MSTEDEDENKTTPFMRDDEPAPKPVAPSDGPSSTVEVSPYRQETFPVAKKPTGGMFGNFDRSKSQKAPPWAVPLLVAVVIGHVGFFLVGYIKSIWDIEMLDRPKTKVELALAPSPPPPPPPPPGGAKQVQKTFEPKKIKVKDIVQPIKIEKQEKQVVETSSEQAGEEGGEEGGVEGGVVGGDINGVAGAPPPPPPPPPPPAPPQNVPPTLLEGMRIAGEKMIIPDDVTKNEIGRSGKDKVIGSFKICLDLTCKVTSVTQLKSTGFPAYDNKIQAKMRGDWKYKPYAVNGRVVFVCTAVTFIYSQK